VTQTLSITIRNAQRHEVLHALESVPKRFDKYEWSLADTEQGPKLTGVLMRPLGYCISADVQDAADFLRPLSVRVRADWGLNFTEGSWSA